MNIRHIIYLFIKKPIPEAFTDIFFNETKTIRKI